MDYLLLNLEIFLVASCYRNWDKLQPDWPFGLQADISDLSLLKQPASKLNAQHYPGSIAIHEIVIPGCVRNLLVRIHVQVNYSDC